jgi:hypothetical protein
VKKRLGWIFSVCVGAGGLYCAATGHSTTNAAPQQQLATQRQPAQTHSVPPSASDATLAATAPRQKTSVLVSATEVPKVGQRDSHRTGNAPDNFEIAVKPMIRETCGDCHNPTKLKGNLDLEQFLTESGPEALKQREIWTLVARKLQAGEMPPDGKPKPPAEQVAAVTRWIEQQYALLDHNARPDPGRVTAHRLNRYEYNNTVRDLLAVNLRSADDFPPDAYGYGFDNIGDVLSLSPVLTEKYLKAAERVAKAAIPIGPSEKVLAVRYETQAMGQQSHMHVQTMHDFPVDGLYNLRVGWEQGAAAGTLMTGHIYVDGKEVLNLPIVFDSRQDRAIYARNVPISQGPHLFEAQMEVAPDSQQPRPLKGRLPYPTVMEVFGPFNQVSREQTKSYKRIFFKGPPPAQNQTEYARQILARLVHRAYRRPVAKSELDQLVNLAQLVQSQGGSFEGAIQVALEAVLMSPNFLFRIEQDPPGDVPHRISDTELASRLSYFLWSSMPDDELLSLAERGRLHDPEVLHAQVRRMMADTKARSLASNFGGQWLQTRNLDFKGPDTKAFPDYDVELRDAMRTETEMFFQAVVAEDRSILDFLDGKFTFVNERLANLYGIPGVQGREFRRVKLDGTERSGILTQASVLTVSSYPTRTSPVIRGKWVLENILNTPPPEPPANVPALDDHAVGKTTSVRQQLEQHRSNPVCAGCHSRMDPLGFGMENYDAMGRWRTTEGQVPLDTTGLLPDGRTFSGAAQLKAMLRADSPKFARALSEKLLTYALGRGLESNDEPAIHKIELRVEQRGYRFSELVGAIVDSVPFQMRQRETIKSESVKTASLDTKSQAEPQSKSE